MEIPIRVSLDCLGNLTANWKEGDERHTYTIYSNATPNEQYQRLSQVLHEKLPEILITDLRYLRARRFEEGSVRRHYQVRQRLVKRNNHKRHYYNKVR